jgi:hypothetical protein
MTLYMAGAKMLHYFPVSIPYHGSALNITVQSYAGSLEFGLTACRRILSQDESYELIGHLRTALREIQALPSVATIAQAEASVSKDQAKVSTKGESVVPAPPVLVHQGLAAAEGVANTQSNSDVKPSTERSTQRPRRSGRQMPHAGD